jgi:tetratricopeptide (TPR) repeat protein
MRRGRELLENGDAAGARLHLERAVSLFPESPYARGLFARCLFETGQLEHALFLYESLHLELPGSAGARVNLAVVLLKLGRASLARPLLEDAIDADPTHRAAWGYLGVALEQLGLLDDAEAALLAGHHGAAARRVRERHAETPFATAPAPEDVWWESGIARTANAPRPPPVAGDQRRDADAVEEIPLETAIAPSRTGSALLDAALSSLLVQDDLDG